MCEVQGSRDKQEEKNAPSIVRREKSKENPAKITPVSKLEINK